MSQFFFLSSDVIRIQRLTHTNSQLCLVRSVEVDRGRGRGGKKEVVILSTLGSEKDCKTRLTHRLKLIRVEFCPLTEGFFANKEGKICARPNHMK